MAKKIAKSDAGYVGHPIAGKQCDGCTMFEPADECNLVRGQISRRGHCKFFEEVEMSKATKTATTSDTFDFFLPLTKVDKKTRTVSGYASTPSLDMDGEVVSLDAVKAALPGYWEWRNIREMHQPSAVGVAQEANVDDVGLFLTSKITDDAAWKKVEEGVYKGYSIGGRKLAKKGNIITQIEMVEVSLVDRPANPDCKITVAKRAKEAKDGIGAFLLKAPKGTALAKEGPPAARDGLSLPAPVKCAAHNMLDCKKCAKAAKRATKVASMVDAVAAAMKAGTPDPKIIEKREYSDDQRKQFAESGVALPDGSYPIPDKAALSDAISAYGRAGDKSKARKHIMRRAKALGNTDLIPENWHKGAIQTAPAEVDKAAIAEAVAAGYGLTSSAQPSFLSLTKVEGGGDKLLSGAEYDLEVRESAVPSFELGALSTKIGNGGGRGKIKKGMSTVGDLAYSFDRLRSVQRQLVMEAKREGGDKKDLKISTELGDISRRVASLMATKATHEGEEALDFSDADDEYIKRFLEDDEVMANKNVTGDPLGEAILNVMKRAAAPSRMQRMEMTATNLKNANKSRKAARSAIEDAHKMLKAAYLAKAAGKKAKDDDGEVDLAGAMEKLQKAYGEVEKLGVFVKAARGQLTKMGRSGQRGQEAGDGDEFYQVPAGVKDLSPNALATASPGGGGSGSMPPGYPGSEGTDPSSVYAGKAARLAKGGGLNAESAALLAENARLEGANEALLAARTAGNRNRPFNFDMSKMIGNGEASGGHAGGTKVDPLWKAIKDSGVDPGALVVEGPDENPVTKAARANVVGQYLIDGGNAKPIYDPAFRGGAAGRA